ncbi:GTPase ObgE [Deltaproteobacteria bacterium TL4]
MKFVDSVKIHIRSGDGGVGCTSFRREKYVPLGGPDGGDGGKGGNVTFQGNPNKNTLLDLSFQQHQHAKNGGHGKGSKQHGKNGEDVLISVPLGTVITDVDTGEALLEILDNEAYVFLKGGIGGRGNARFKTSTNRAPEYHQPGLPGVEMWVRLELKLMADVGLVGFPNAGKSTLISAISHAHPKIADYPFTTLVPQLGVVKMDQFEAFVVADIPGLIEGAHEGVGLGDRFLKHIERTATLLILLDVSGFAEHPPWEEYKILKHELSKFSPTMMEKSHVVVLNKLDAVSDRSEVLQLKSQLAEAGETVFEISAVTRQGLDELLPFLSKMVKIARQKRAEVDSQHQS